MPDANRVPTALPDLLDSKQLKLRHLFLGAEAVDLSALQPFQTAHPETRLYNLYGPTEATVFVASHEIKPSDCQNRAHAPLGRATGGTALLVLDDLGNPVPSGGTGDLFVAGPAVTKGYLGRPHLTEQVFQMRNNTRLYRTGDLARFASDGLLEFRGRADQQVKLRGFRIELGEISAALSKMPGILDAAVVLHQEQGLTDLAAYVVGTTPDDLRGRLAACLPPHMVPRWITVLESLPMTANGKLDRRALPRPKGAVRTGQPPETAMEKALARHWCALLNLDQVFIEDDFFALGGHSLLATRLRAALEQDLGQQFPLKTLFETRRLSAMAAALEALNTPEDTFDDLTAFMSELETQ